MSLTPHMAAASPRASETTGEPRVPHEALLITLVCLAQFMVLLDVSIVNIALPAIRRDLGFSSSTLVWVINAYTVTVAGFLLLSGRASDLFGAKRVFLTGITLFTLASFVAGLAVTPIWLVAARAAQGLGGAVVAPSTLAILTVAFPEGARRTRAFGIWTGVASSGTAAGGLLGGLITGYTSWRWVFFVNVPLGVAAGVLGALLLSNACHDDGATSLDVPGALSGTAGLACLVYAIARSGSGRWSSSATSVPLTFGVVLVVFFVFYEARWASRPLLPVRIFRSRMLSGANAVQLVLAGAFFSVWYFVALDLQSVHGYSAQRAGLAFLPLTAGVIVGTLASSRIVAAIGVRTPLAVGLAAAAAGFVWLGNLGLGDGYWGAILPASIIVSIGLGAALTPLATAATSGVARPDAGIAAGVFNTSRQVGGSIGLAVLAAVAAAQSNASASPHARILSLSAGYNRAFVISAVLCAAAAAIAAVVLPRSSSLPRRFR